MMKKFLFLFIISFISCQVFSQVDLKAKSILDKVSEKTKNYPSINAAFEFIMQNDAAGLKEVKEGNLILQKNKYKLSMDGIEIYCDGTSQWTFMKDAGEVNLSDASSNDVDALNPASIFTIYEKGFKNTYLGEFSNGTKKTHKIELVPTSKMDFTKIIIEIDQATNQILSANMISNDGNNFIIKVKSMSTNNNYPASTFMFDSKKNPKVQVIDMR